MIDQRRWSPALKALYQKHYPQGSPAPAMKAPPDSTPTPGPMLGGHSQPALGASLGMPGLSALPRTVDLAMKTPGPLPGSSPGMSALPGALSAPHRVARAATSAATGPVAQTDHNAEAVLDPPATPTGFTPLQSRFQKIDADKAYSDDLSALMPVFAQWRDYYARTGAEPGSGVGDAAYERWPQRMKDYYEDWWQTTHPGGLLDNNGVRHAVETPFFQELEDYFNKLQLAQRDDPNYVPAGGDPSGGTGAAVRQAIPGVYPEAMHNYKGSKFTPEEQQFLTTELAPGIQTHRSAQEESQQLAEDLSAGRYDVGDLMSPGLEAQTTGRADPSAYDPVLKHAQDQVVDRYQREILPSISDEAQAYGQAGGTRHGVAEGLAAQGLERTLGELSSQMGLEAYRDAQARVLPATQARAALRSQSQEDRWRRRSQGLAQRRARTQEADDYIARMLKYWRYGTDQDADALQRYLSMLQLGSPGPSTSNSQPLYRNKTAEAIGTISSLASLISMF